MSKYGKRLKALEFRKNGQSLREISQGLKVSKGTVSLWCRDIKLSEKQSRILAQRCVAGMNRGRLIGARINHDRKLLMINSAFDDARKLINGFSLRDLLIIGIGLYWAEGSKSESTSSFLFINSDVRMILLMKRFLKKICHIDEKNMVCTIQINEIHKIRINKILKFWSDSLNLPPNQFNRPYYVKTKLKKIYANHDSYFGILRLRVRKSSALKYKMIGLIEVLKNVNLSR